MTLRTSRLILRPFDAHDLDRMAELFANENFMRFSLGPLTRKQARAFLDKVITRDRAGLPSQFAVVERASNSLVGYSGFFHQEVDGTTEIEIGYRFDSQFWNRGLATEAARAVRDHGFEELELKRVISLIHPANHASRRVAEKNGMKLERETTFKGFPTLVFAIMKEEWQRLVSAV